jgi:hypothetical protein
MIARLVILAALLTVCSAPPAQTPAPVPAPAVPISLQSCPYVPPPPPPPRPPRTVEALARYANAAAQTAVKARAALAECNARREMALRLLTEKQ